MLALLAGFAFPAPLLLLTLTLGAAVSALLGPLRWRRVIGRRIIVAALAAVRVRLGGGVGELWEHEVVFALDVVARVTKACHLALECGLEQVLAGGGTHRLRACPSPSHVFS